MSGAQRRISRVGRSRDQTKSAYNRMSRWYDFVAGRSERDLGEAGVKKLGVKNGETVLEIGFGTGSCIISLAGAVGESGKVYGIDLSDGMLKVATAKVERSGLSRSVRLSLGDATKLPFEADQFDAVFMSFTLELFDTEEIPVVLAECKRVLRDNGRICIVSLSKKGREGFMTRLYEWAHRSFSSYVDCRPIFAEEAIKEAGFKVCATTEASMWGLPVETVLATKTQCDLMMNGARASRGQLDV